MNSRGMGDSYEARDIKRKEFRREMEETKLVDVLIKCKKDLLLLDREEVLEEIESKKRRVLELKEDALKLEAELLEIDSALKQHDKEMEGEQNA